MTGFVIQIIESPSAENLLDRVEEGAALQECLRMMGVSSERYLVTKEEMLIEATRRIAAAHEKGAAYEEHVPVLHMSCHGDKDGIALTSGERIDWKRLGEIIRPINAAAGNALVLGMSACQGYEALDMARTLAQAPPFGILVGPTTNVSWRVSMVAFITFYHLFTDLFTKKPPPTQEVFTALIATVNAAAGVSPPTFDGAVAAVVQKNFKQALLDALRTPERQQRMTSLVQQLRRANRTQ